jgi:hypothetical protein
MIRLILSISLLVTFVFDVTAQKKEKSIFEEKNLRGNVSYLEETTYAVSDYFGEVKKDSLITKFSFKFDKSGNVIEKQEYYKRFNLPVAVTKTKYNEKGNKTEVSWFQSKKSNGLTIYKYDSLDNLIQTESFFCDKLSGKSIRKYDEKANNIEFRAYDEAGKIEQVYINKFDDKGNEIETKIYLENGKLNEVVKKKYDEKGNLIEQGSYDREGTLYRDKLIYTYDNMSNVISEDKQNTLSPSYSRKHTYKHDINGNKIEMKLYDYPNYSLKHIDNYKYDSFGNIIEDLNIYSYLSESKNFKNDVVRGHYYKYEYDYFNNWTKKLDYGNFELIEITERTIEYYLD